MFHKTSLKTAALGLAVLGGLTLNDARADELQQATLGGGCFWCLEAVYEELTGVTKVESGYTGGRTVDPTYQEICGGDTGHAEVVQVTFNPAVTSYAEILGVFFTIHDPTTLNRQGADQGTQYRSAIFVHDEDQRRTAEAAVDAVNESGAWPNRVVTEITPLHKFYRAEDYHQDYYARNATQGYCQLIINPKLAKFRERYAAKLKKSS